MSNQLPPGPNLPKHLQTLLWSAQPTKLLDRCAREYGTTFTLKLPPTGNWIFTSDPQAVQQVFKANPDDVPVANGKSILKPILGPNSVLIINGAEHLTQRRLLLPPFHGERMRTYQALTVAITKAELASWPKGKPVTLHTAMNRITLAVIEQAVFGMEQSERLLRLRRAVKRLLKLSSTRASLPFWVRNAGRAEPRGYLGRVIGAIDREIYGEIAQRRKLDYAVRTDILSMLLCAKDEDGNGLSDHELRDELVTLLFAGHETTATALTWCLDLLLHDEKVMQKLLTEIGKGSEEYLDATVKESLRLRPVIPIISRQLQQPFEIDGYHLPAGTLLAPSIYLLQRRADIYPEPELFKPERFLNQKTPSFGWIPFGGGTRRCIGAAFATTQIKTVLTTILSNVELTPEDVSPATVRRRNITLTPRNGVPARWSTNS